MSSEDKMERLNELDKIQRNDHDMLVRLESKVDTLITGFSEFKTGVSSSVNNLELRIDALELWQNTTKVERRTAVAIASGIGSVVGFIISLATKFFFKNNA